jgi:hypothetical protein
MVSAHRSNFEAISKWGLSPRIKNTFQNYNYEFYFKEDSCPERRIGKDGRK